MSTKSESAQPLPPHPTQPPWRSHPHASAWERVRDAFRRDWNQTQADFIGGLGQELNQTATDTLKQAVGPGSVPPLAVKTHQDTPTRIEVTQERLLADMKTQTQKVTRARRESRQTETLHPVQDAAAHEDAARRWRALEPAARFGFTAHSQFPGQHAWSGQVEDALSAQWQALSSGPSFNQAKDDIQRGWEYADSTTGGT